MNYVGRKLVPWPVLALLFVAIVIIFFQLMWLSHRSASQALTAILFPGFIPISLLIYNLQSSAWLTFDEKGFVLKKLWLEKRYQYSQIVSFAARKGLWNASYNISTRNWDQIFLKFQEKDKTSLICLHMSSNDDDWQSFYTYIHQNLKEKMEQQLAEKGHIESEVYTLTKEIIGDKKRNIEIQLEQIKHMEWTNNQIFLFRSNQHNPEIVFSPNDENIYPLGLLLKEKFAWPPKATQKILFEQTVLQEYALAYLLLIIGVIFSIMCLFYAYEGDSTWLPIHQSRYFWIIIFVLDIVAMCYLRLNEAKSIQAYENNIQEVVGQKTFSIPYEEVAELTFHDYQETDRGVFMGRFLDIVVTNENSRKIKMKLHIRNAGENVETFGEYLGKKIANQWWQKWQQGKEIVWIDALTKYTLTSNNLEKLDGKEKQSYSYQNIHTITIDEEQTKILGADRLEKIIRIEWKDSTEPIVISSSYKNLWPGYFLLQKIIQHS